MDKPLLRDPNIQPTKEVLANALGNSYLVFEELMEIITDAKYALVPIWNYYKDGNAWLCKVCYKKKTVFWLSAWDGFFKTGFYFTEKNSQGVMELNIEKSIKDDFISGKHIGKLIPLGINIDRKEQIKDLLNIIEYKKKL